MKTILIIQQRLGSTRLPGKALLPLCGKSMTWHIVERCKRAKLVDEVVVATPFADAIEIGKAVDCQVVAPQVPENDLIARYYTVAAGMKADYVIRVSGDNPCIESSAIDDLIEHTLHIEELDHEYSPAPCRVLRMNSENLRHNYDGFGGELYTMEMLEWMDKTLKNPIHREHPHKFWAEIDAYCYIGNIYPSGFRLEVDTQADYEKIKDIYEVLYTTNHEFTVKDVMEYLNGKKETVQPFGVGVYD